MIKISGKVDKSNTYNGFSGNIRSLLTEELYQTKLFLRFFIFSTGCISCLQPFPSLNTFLHSPFVYLFFIC